MPIWDIRSRVRRRTKTCTRAALRLRCRNPPAPLIRGALEGLSLSPCGLQKFPPDKGGKGGSIPDNKSLAEKARQNRKNPTPAEPMGWRGPAKQTPRSRTISMRRITTWRVDRPDIRTQTALSPRNSGESRSPEVFGGRWIAGQAPNDRLGALSDSIRTRNALIRPTS